MFEFIKKSPLGIILTAAALVFVASPEARATTRKLAVKGTAVILDLVEQARNSTSLMSQLDSEAQGLYKAETGQTPKAEGGSITPDKEQD